MLYKIDIRYIAGFFDGEGSIYLKDGQYRVVLNQKPKYVLELIQKFFNRYEIKSTIYVNRGIHELRISRQREISILINLLEPYLIVKHQEILNAINFYKQNGFKGYCLLESEKREVRKLKQQGNYYNTELADKFQCSAQTIRTIVNV